MTSTDSIQTNNPLKEVGAKLIQLIVDQGYVPANVMAFMKPQDFLAERFSGGLGVLFQDPQDPPKKLCFGRILRPERRRHIATIWVENEAREATLTHWVVEVCGQENDTQIDALIHEIKEAFGVEVRTKLKRPDVAYELLRGE